MHDEYHEHVEIRKAIGSSTWISMTFSKTFDIKVKMLTLSIGSYFLWIGFISANFKGLEKESVLTESFIHLHKNCENNLLPLTGCPHQKTLYNLMWK